MFGWYLPYKSISMAYIHTYIHLYIHTDTQTHIHTHIHTTEHTYRNTLSWRCYEVKNATTVVTAAAGATPEAIETKTKQQTMEQRGRMMRVANVRELKRFSVWLRRKEEERGGKRALVI